MVITAYSKNIALLLGLLMTTAVAGAEPPAAEVGQAGGEAAAQAGMNLTFEQRHRDILNDLFRERERAILPMEIRTLIRTHAETGVTPGLRRDITVGRPLPMEITRQVVYLPEAVNGRLGWELDSRYRVGVYGTNVFLYDAGNNRVLDILDNVFEADDIR